MAGRVEIKEAGMEAAPAGQAARPAARRAAALPEATAEDSKGAEVNKAASKMARKADPSIRLRRCSWSRTRWSMRLTGITMEQWTRMNSPMRVIHSKKSTAMETAS